MNTTPYTTTIFFDDDAHYDDGAGWTIDGGISVRFPTLEQAVAYCESNNLPWGSENGVCECGFIYDSACRTDHDADTGQCWECSDRSPNDMTGMEWTAYLYDDQTAVFAVAVARMIVNGNIGDARRAMADEGFTTFAIDLLRALVEQTGDDWLACYKRLGRIAEG